MKALSCSFCCVYLTKLTISKNGYENGANIATIILENISHFLFDSWYDLKRLYQNNLSLISWVKIDIITFNDTLLKLCAIINRCENVINLTVNDIVPGYRKQVKIIAYPTVAAACVPEAIFKPYFYCMICMHEIISLNRYCNTFLR